MISGIASFRDQGSAFGTLRSQVTKSPQTNSKGASKATFLQTSFLLNSLSNFRSPSFMHRSWRTAMRNSWMSLRQNHDQRVRARSHCGKQNAKRCVFMTVARQICILEYGVSLSCKRGVKRTQTKTGVSEGGGEDSRKRKRSQTRAQKCTLFFAKTKSFLLPAFSKI